MHNLELSFFVVPRGLCGGLVCVGNLPTCPRTQGCVKGWSLERAKQLVEASVATARLGQAELS
jgi:hypothetical protein